MNTVIKKSEKMQEKFEMEIHMLTAHLQTSQQNVDSYKVVLMKCYDSFAKFYTISKIRH